MAENNAITEIKIGGKLVPFIQDEVTNNGRFFIVDSNDISFDNGGTSVTQKVITVNMDLSKAIEDVDAKLTEDLTNKYKELSDKIDDYQTKINNRLTGIENRLSVLEMAVSGDTTKVELELENPPVYTKGEYTVKAKAHVYNGDEVQSYKWYINDDLQSFESNEFTKSYDNNTRDDIKYDIKCIIITKNGITVVSDILEVTIPGIELNKISITPNKSSVTESTGSIKLKVSDFISQNYNGDKKFECKWEILGNTKINQIFIEDGNNGTVESWSSVENGTSEITIKGGLVSNKTQESITIKMTPQIDKTGINTENTNIGEPINITIKVGKNEVINYYWYIGQEKLTSDSEVESKGIKISSQSQITNPLTWTSSDYVYFIYPTEFGTAKIVDEAGDDAGGKAIESLSGVSFTKYKGWRFNKENQGIKYTVTFIK